MTVNELPFLSLYLFRFFYSFIYLFSSFLPPFDFLIVLFIGTSSDSIREENFVAFLLHDWVSACYRLREAQVAEVAAQKAAGLEISDDIFDEEEEPDSDPPESGDESSNPPDSTVEDEDEDEDE